MEKSRKIVRLSKEDIPEILQKPILLFNYEEVESKIENLSPLGIGLIIDKNSEIDKGDIFYLKYYALESDIKCLCVFSDRDENEKNIGAYFTEESDKKIILEHLHLKIEG